MPLPAALAAIEAADVITIGPGSLFTSIIPNLLVTSVAEAIGSAAATKIFIGNLMTQPGETDGYGFREHLVTVRKYAPQINFDYVLVNDRLITRHQADLYRADGANQVLADDQDVASYNIVGADLLDEGEMVRHNPERLARVVMSCASTSLSANLSSPELVSAN
jgi:uncharacterized cofD-like protein